MRKSARLVGKDRQSHSLRSPVHALNVEGAWLFNMLFGALVPFLLLSCGYVCCRQTDPWPMHDHFYRTRSAKWREATTWQHFNQDSPRVANFSVFNGEFSVGIHDYIFSFLV